MQIHLSEVLSQPEQSRNYTVPLEMDCFAYAGMSYPIIKKEPVQLTIYHKGGKKLEITAVVAVVLSASCDRCLSEVTVPLSFQSELEVDMGQTVEERIQNLEETVFIEGYMLDVDKLVRCEMVVHMPVKILCREECTGLESGRGESDGGEDRPADPRMAAIRDIFQKANQEGNKEV